MEDDVNALLGGEELSEEFKAKAKTIFEAAINSKVAEIKVLLLKTEYESRSLLKKLLKKKKHFKSVLILILSMSQMSGWKRTHSPSKTVLKLN